MRINKQTMQYVLCALWGKCGVVEDYIFCNENANPPTSQGVNENVPYEHRAVLCVKIRDTVKAKHNETKSEQKTDYLKKFKK